MLISLGIALVFAVLSFAALRRVSAAIIVFVLVAFIVYHAMPTLAWGFVGPPALIVATGVFLVAYAWLAKDVSARRRRQLVLPLLYGGAVVLLFLVVVFFTTSGVFHHAAYRALIGDVPESTYSTDTSPVDPAQVRVVDQALAARLADKRLGQNTALGSQVTVGTMNIQKVGDQLYWVGPLNHTGLFKWLRNRSGTPGYVMVSATDERDVHLVEKVNGQPLHLKYNMGSWFGDQPRRYLYTHGYATAGLTDFTFEVDDAGVPHWVVTRYRKAIGFSGDDAVGVVVLDAQTGDIHEYGIDPAPAWIDRIQPADVIVEQLDDWGHFVHGWWLQNTSHLDELQATPGTSLVYGNDGQSYWYTGLTSTGADQATVGFVLVNTRNKKARFYKQTGATEIAAMGSAEGSVQNLGYHGTFPILYNVSGLPTYFLTLKDKSGLVKDYAFVSVENYQIVGVGEDVSSALRSYRRSVASRGNDIAPDGPVHYEHVAGRVTRLTTETKQGDTYYYMMIAGVDSMAFVGSSGLSPEIPLTREGDSVAIAYENGGGALVDMMEFDNTGLSFQTTEAQRRVTERADSVRSAQRQERGPS